MYILKIILFMSFLLFIYLIFVGSNLNKSEEERIREDQEQIEYLRNYKNKK